MEKVEHIAKRLIQVPSHSEKSKVIIRVASLLRKLGGKVTVSSKESGYILARFGKGDGVLFAGHLDTVPQQRPSRKKPGTVSAGKLYGPGASDMKGGCAAVLAAARRLKGKVSFSIAFTTDEETTMMGADLISRTPVARRALAIVIPEPTNLLVASSEKGLVQIQVSIWGRSAHASMPWFGRNAAQRMVKFLSQLEFLRDPEMHLPAGITVNLGILKAGTVPNAVPDFATAILDVRFPPSSNPSVVLRGIREILGGSGVKWELKKIHEVPPLEFDVNSEVVQTFLGTSDTKVTSVMYATEACRYAATGRPIVVCGPGRPELAHQQEEFVDVFQLKRAEKAYVDFCLALSRGR